MSNENLIYVKLCGHFRIKPGTSQRVNELMEKKGLTQAENDELKSCLLC